MSQQCLGNPAGRAAQGRGGQAAPPAAGAQIDPTSIDRGTQIYRPSCAFCHGVDARGAQAPDLGKSLEVLNDTNGKELGEFLKMGRPDKGMPAFATFTNDQMTDLASFLHSVTADARKRLPMDNNAIVVGDSKAGQAYFNGAGKCSTCHSPTGDLKGIGSKYDAATLQDRFVNPRVGRGNVARIPARVKVSLPNGQVVSGDLIAVTDFYVTLQDESGVRRTISRDNDVPKVEINDPIQAHLDMLLNWTDDNMHNLTAYLVGLK
jgi:mono/diheme cytochrome c family protein